MSIKYEVGSITTLLSSSTEWTSDGIAQNEAALGAEYDNSSASNLFLWADFELNVTFSTAPADRATVDLYLITAPDGTNYGYSVTTDEAAGRAPANFLVGSWEVTNITSAQRISIIGARLSPVKFKPVVINRTAQTIPNTSTVKILPYRMQ